MTTGWKSLFRNNQNSDITITVPKDTYLEMISADLSVGDLYMEDIKTKRLHLILVWVILI